jgi:hypothetical protein
MDIGLNNGAGEDHLGIKDRGTRPNACRASGTLSGHGRDGCHRREDQGGFIGRDEILACSGKALNDQRLD